MRTIIALFIFSFLTSISFSQSVVGQGSYSINGNISFSSTTTENRAGSISEFTFNPSVGYFFADNLLTGVSVRYYSISSGDYSNSNYGFGPSLRYFFDATDNLKPFLGLSYYYSILDSDDDVSANTVILSGGVDLFVTKSFAIEGSVNYSNSVHDYPAGPFGDDPTIEVISVGLGVNYFIHE